MPTSATNTQYIELMCASIDKGQLIFEKENGVDHALALGAFLLKIPQHIDIDSGLQFCQNFYKPDTQNLNDQYSGHREKTHPKSKLGYEDRPNQVEQLQIESYLWTEYLPSKVTALLNEMKSITRDSLYSLFHSIGIPRMHWDRVTGGSFDEAGLCYTTINHYRSDIKNKIGIVEHTDSGFITVIYADQPGFEIYKDGLWAPIENKPGYFVVNLGDAFEVLTKNLPKPGTAVMHRVVETHPEKNQPDRSSFTVYMGPTFDMDLYQYGQDRDLYEFQSFKEFSILKAERMGYEFHSRV